MFEPEPFWSHLERSASVSDAGAASRRLENYKALGWSSVTSSAQVFAVFTQEDLS